MERRQSTRIKSPDTNKSPNKSPDSNKVFNFKQASERKKCITKQGFLCFILQILSILEVGCVVMTIHTFLYNDYKIQFGLQLAFFLFSKILKAAYFLKMKEYFKVILIFLCLDYLAIYLMIRADKRLNQDIEEGDKKVRLEWVEMKKQQQEKIDQYIQSLQPQPQKVDQKDKTATPIKKLTLNVKKQYEKTDLPTENELGLTGTPQKITHSTYINTTEPARKESNIPSAQQRQIQASTPAKTESNARSPVMDYEFFNTNRLSVNTAQFYMQTENEKSLENTLKTNPQQEDNQQMVDQLQIRKASQFMKRVDDYQNKQAQQNFHLEVAGTQPQRKNTDHGSPNKQRSPSRSLSNKRRGTVSKQQAEEEKKKKKPERQLTNQIKSNVLKKLKLTQEQLFNLVNNKFITIYIEEDLEEKNEEYFLRRKLTLSAMRVYDGIFMDAPCLYILTYIIANYLDLVKLYPLLKIAYWFIVVCLSLSICFFNNIQNIPFRQHDNYFSIQLISFVKNFIIVLSTIVSTTILWAFSSNNGLALLIYDCSIFLVIIHQVYSLMKKVYQEEIRGDRLFAFFLFLLCFIFSVFVGSLLVFANCILLLNSELAHEALLQLRKQLESPDPKIKKDDLFVLVEKSKYGFRFLQRQNLFFLLNIIFLAIISLFVNELYNFQWDSEIIFYHKFLLGFMPVSVLGILWQIQDSKFFNETLIKQVFTHYNRIRDKLKILRRKVKIQEQNYKLLDDVHKEIEGQLNILVQKLNDQEKLLKDFEAEEQKLNKNLSQFSTFGNSQKSDNLKLLTISKRIKDIKQKRDEVRNEIHQLKPIFEVKNEEIQGKHKELKETQEILNLYAKINGINLDEEIILDDDIQVNVADQYGYHHNHR